MFKNPFSFEGRIRRKEYVLSLLFYIITADIIDMAVKLSQATAILEIAYIPLTWFIIAQGVKRCHDRGHSGWYQIIPFYVLAMIFINDNIGENEYGANPKGIGDHAEIDEIGKDIVK